MTIGDLLTNRTVEGFAIREHGLCSFKISGGYALTQESLLRYVDKAGAFISSFDHKHQFGLPAPYDAEQEIRDKVEGQVIRRVDVAPDTGDLIVHLDEGRIEIICTSAGYEAYQLYGPNNLIMVGRGGRGMKSEQAAAPNGGPATRLGNSGAIEGPPSVS